MSFDAQYAKDLCKLCATICEKCATECAMFKDDHCVKCSNEYKACTNECKAMTQQYLLPKSRRMQFVVIFLFRYGNTSIGGVFYVFP